MLGIRAALSNGWAILGSEFTQSLRFPRDVAISHISDESIVYGRMKMVYVLRILHPAWAHWRRTMSNRIYAVGHCAKMGPEEVPGEIHMVGRRAIWDSWISAQSRDVVDSMRRAAPLAIWYNKL